MTIHNHQQETLKKRHIYKDKRLVHFFDKLQLIENFGTGIPRTQDAYKNTGKKPEFHDSENFFIVYLPNLNYYDQINDQINDKITELGLSILRVVNSNPGIKVNMIHELVSKDDGNGYSQHD